MASITHRRGVPALPDAAACAAGGVFGYLLRAAGRAVQLGLIDLLIQHQEGPQALERLAGMLAKPDDLDVYRYLVIALLSAHQPQLRAMVMMANGHRGAASAPGNTP